MRSFEIPPHSWHPVTDLLHQAPNFLILKGNTPPACSVVAHPMSKPFPLADSQRNPWRYVYSLETSTSSIGLLSLQGTDPPVA
jgi:hypothetical protein